MTLVLELTEEQEARLREEAEEHGQSVQEYALERLLPAAPRSGHEVLDNLRKAGVIGTFADRPDSPEFARQLREEAERRSA